MKKSASKIHRFDTIEKELTDAPSGREALFLDNAFSRRLCDFVDSKLEGKQVLSLDIFDTLLLRDNSSELSRFYEIGGEMAHLIKRKTGQNVSQIDAFYARCLGTKASYRCSSKVQGCGEGALVDIHRTASQLLVNSEKLSSDFIDIELKYEAKRLKKNPFFMSYISRQLGFGREVILISDMYMNKEQLIVLLGYMGIPSDKYSFLISSADVKISKASGKIFKFIESEVSINPGEVLHIGDSFKGDVAQPIKNGWSALHLPLSSYDIEERKKDHRETASFLLEKFGLSIDIQMPK